MYIKVNDPLNLFIIIIYFFSFFFLYNSVSLLPSLHLHSNILYTRDELKNIYVEDEEEKKTYFFNARLLHNVE